MNWHTRRFTHSRKTTRVNTVNVNKMMPPLSAEKQTLLTRRRLLRSMVGLPLASSLPLTQARAASSPAQTATYRKNPNLKPVHSGVIGSPFVDGQFLNWDLQPGGSPFSDVLKWKLTPNPQAEQKASSNYQVPVINTASLIKDRYRDPSHNFICWLGHASFLIQLDGKRLLTDPCLTAPPFMERLSQLPFPIELIRPDYLLISHGHYDHLDRDTLAVFESGHALVPLDMGDLIKDMNPSLTVQQAAWYQYYQIQETFRISFLPAYHWYRRTLTDKNTQLWGSFMIEFEGKRLYFAGDSAYAPHFKTIGKIFPSIDYALLPIGAYRPRWMMKNSHMDPIEALQAHDDLGANTFLPMHYGTFDLTDEPMAEPVQLLKTARVEQRLRFPAIGELVTF